MVDFRARPIDSGLLQEYIAAKGRSGIGEGVSALSKGLTQGLAITDAINTMKQKKRISELVSTMKETPEFHDLNAQSGGTLELVAQTNPGALPQMIAAMQKQSQSAIQPVMTREEALAAGEVPKGTKIIATPKPEVPFSQKLDEAGQMAGVKAEAEIAKQVEAKESKEASTAKTGYKMIENKTNVFVNELQKFYKEAGVNINEQGWQVKGKLALNKLANKAGYKEQVEKLQGLIVEVAISIAKLAAPSARVGKDLLAQVSKTIPTDMSTGPSAFEQLKATIHNAVAGSLAMQGKDYNSESSEWQQVEEQFSELWNKMGFKGSNTNKSGGQLMIDAQGNKAMVYPDGSFEEVQ